MVIPESVLLAITFVSLLGSALIAGVFYAFSTFVMKALAVRPAGEGIAAMQSINVVVLNPAFLGVFMGTAATSAATAIGGLLQWSRPGAAYLLAGGVLYVVGTFLVTIMFNVPLNNALAAVTTADADGQRVWAEYLRRWTAWNHVRTAAALAATGAFAIGMRY